jgi:hypothetical protein
MPDRSKQPTWPFYDEYELSEPTAAAMHPSHLLNFVFDEHFPFAEERTLGSLHVPSREARKVW